MPLTSYRALLRARPGSSLAVILHFRYRIFFPSLTHSLVHSLSLSPFTLAVFLLSFLFVV